MLKGRHPPEFEEQHTPSSSPRSFRREVSVGFFRSVANRSVFVLPRRSYALKGAASRRALLPTMPRNHNLRVTSGTHSIKALCLRPGQLQPLCVHLHVSVFEGLTRVHLASFTGNTVTSCTSPHVSISSRPPSLPVTPAREVASSMKSASSVGCLSWEAWSGPWETSRGLIAYKQVRCPRCVSARLRHHRSQPSR